MFIHYTKEEKAEVERRKLSLKSGMRIKCTEMLNDPRQIEPGTTGTVDFVDDGGQIHVHWDNGRGLALAIEDKYEVIDWYQLQ